MRSGWLLCLVACGSTPPPAAEPAPIVTPDAREAPVATVVKSDPVVDAFAGLLGNPPGTLGTVRMGVREISMSVQRRSSRASMNWVVSTFIVNNDDSCNAISELLAKKWPGGTPFVDGDDHWITWSDTTTRSVWLTNPGRCELRFEPWHDVTAKYWLEGAAAALTLTTLEVPMIRDVLGTDATVAGDRLEWWVPGLGAGVGAVTCHTASMTDSSISCSGISSSAMFDEISAWLDATFGAHGSELAWSSAAVQIVLSRDGARWTLSTTREHPAPSPQLVKTCTQAAKAMVAKSPKSNPAEGDELLHACVESPWPAATLSCLSAAKARPAILACIEQLPSPLRDAYRDRFTND